MPSDRADVQMVKLPRPLVARLDEARGEVTRPKFLDALLGAYERQEIMTTAPEDRRGAERPVLERPGRARQGTPRPDRPTARRQREQVEKRGREIGAARSLRTDAGKREVAPNFKKAK